MTRPEEPEEKLFLPDPEPEGIVIAVRAVCGALAGLFIAGVSWLRMLSDLGVMLTLLWFAAWAASFAYCAVRCGDAFWADWAPPWYRR